MKNHKHYSIAYRAYTNTSFSPEKRAESECTWFDTQKAELEALGCSSEGLEKFERLFVEHMHAKSRCISSMITGPANFPVRRAEKANQAEHNKSVELTDYIARVKKAIDKANNPHKYAISSDADNAIELLKDKLEKMQDNQNKMKMANKILKAAKTTELQKREQLAGVFGADFDIEPMFKPDCFGTIGFAGFSLTNNLASIKTTATRIAELEKAASRVTREINTIEGVRIVENAEENRLQFFFEGKPAADIISLMKSHGFKWTPSVGCWGRLWNGNATYAVNQFILPVLKQHLNKAA